MKNERTSKRIATIAGRMFRKLGDMPVDGRVIIGTSTVPYIDDIGSVKDLYSVLGSVLTQTPDKGKRK